MSGELSPSVVPPASAEDKAEEVTRRTRRTWTSWEDQTLRDRVAHLNSTRGASWRWREIAQVIPGRTAKVRRANAAEKGRCSATRTGHKPEDTPQTNACSRIVASGGFTPWIRHCARGGGPRKRTASSSMRTPDWDLHGTKSPG